MKRRHSRSSTSGPDSRCVERSSASRSPRIESVRCSDSRATRRCDASERSSGALAQTPARAGQQLAPVQAVALVGQVGNDDVVGDVDGGLLVGVTLKRLAQRTVQAPQRVGPACGVVGQSAHGALGLGLAVRQQRVEPDRRGLDVELERLAGLQAAGELPERVPDLLALDGRHHERVLRRRAQVRARARPRW